MPATAEQQLRCRVCDRRLADYWNAVADGAVVIEVRCRHCGVSTKIEVAAK